MYIRNQKAIRVLVWLVDDQDLQAAVEENKTVMWKLSVFFAIVHCIEEMKELTILKFVWYVLLLVGLVGFFSFY